MTIWFTKWTMHKMTDFSATTQAKHIIPRASHHFYLQNIVIALHPLLHCISSSIQSLCDETFPGGTFLIGTNGQRDGLLTQSIVTWHPTLTLSDGLGSCVTHFKGSLDGRKKVPA